MSHRSPANPPNRLQFVVIKGHDNEMAVSRVDTTMHVDLIEPTDRRWRDALAMIRHDFYHLPEYVSLESSRLGGTAVAAYVEQPGVRSVLPLIRGAGVDRLLSRLSRRV